MSSGNLTFTTRDCYHICFSQASCMGDLLSLIQSMISTLLMETKCKKRLLWVHIKKNRSANIGKHRQTVKATPATRKTLRKAVVKKSRSFARNWSSCSFRGSRLNRRSLGEGFCWHLGNVGVGNMTLMMPFLIQERRLLARHMLLVA